MPSSRILNFGTFNFDPVRQVLTRDGRPLGLGRRKASLFAALAARLGEVVTKDELIAAGWDGALVEESNLTVQVSQLRRLLEQEGCPLTISTLSGIGYRLEAAPAAGAPAMLRWRPRIAVTAGATVGVEPGGALSGIHLDVGAALSKFGWLQLVEGDASTVEYSLACRLRVSGGRVRLSLGLRRDSSGAVWAETIDDSGGDGLELSLRLADKAAAVVARIIERCEQQDDATAGTPARQLYFAALSKLVTAREADNAAAYALLQQALDLEPNNVRILSGLMGALEHRSGMGWRPLTADDWQVNADYASRGMAMADADPTSIATSGMVLMSVREHRFAYATIGRAVEMNGASVDVLSCAGISCLHCGGDIDEAMALLHRAYALDPYNAHQKFVLSGISHIHLIRKEYEEARAFALRSLSVNPFYSATHWMLVAVDALQGNRQGAERSLRRYLSLAPDMTLERIIRGQPSKLRDRIAPFLEGLALAGLPEH